MRTHILAVPFVIAAGLFTLSTDSNAALRTTSFVAGNYAMQLGGQSAGFLSSVAGGGVTANATIEKSGGPGQFPKKRVGAAQFDDIVVTVGAPDKPLADWIKAAVNTAQVVKKDGAIIVADQNFKEVARTSWTKGYLSEVTFPELDAANSKKRWELELTITPDSSSYSATAAGKVEAGGLNAKGRQAGLTSNFRMTIPGLNLSRVVQIEEINVRFRAVPSSVPEGERRSFEKTSGTVDVSNLAFTTAEADAPQLYSWYQSFVVKSGGSDKEKKTATIEVLSPDMKTVLNKVTLNGVGIIKVGPTGPATANAEGPRRVRAEAFVESVQIDIP